MIIPPTWTLPEAIKARLGTNTYGRQRAIVEEGHLLLVLHNPPGPDDSSREGVLFWRTPRGEWQCNRGGSGMGALKRHVQTYAELETKLSHDYEQAGGTKSLFDLQEALTPLGRAARNMHDALQTAREAVKNDGFILEVRDLAYESDRNLNLLLEDVRNAIQYLTAREAEEQARLGKEALRASHRLNMLAALFLPLTALTSVFGMNIPNGLNLDGGGLFWVIFIVGVALGFGIKSWVTADEKAAREKK